jgi:hypothetical protein
MIADIAKQKSLRFVFTLLLCTQCVSLAVADDYPRYAALDVIHYRLSLTIKEASD